MSELQLESEKHKKIGMSSWALMQVDDLMKYTILDSYTGLVTRKIHPISSFTDENKKAAEKIILKRMVINDKEIGKVEEALKTLFQQHKLYYHFSIKYSTWVNEPMRFYLRTISSDSLVNIQECRRYENEKNGLKLIAKTDIDKNVKIRCLAGIYKTMDTKREDLLRERKLNFSIIQRTRNNDPVLMLGTAALVNHDCYPNCIYFTVSKHLLIILTTRKIKKDEELVTYYGQNYFGPNNKECQCATCEMNDNGFFSGGKNRELNIVQNNEYVINNKLHKINVREVNFVSNKMDFQSKIASIPSSVHQSSSGCNLHESQSIVQQIDENNVEQFKNELVIKDCTIQQIDPKHIHMPDEISSFYSNSKLESKSSFDKESVESSPKSYSALDMKSDSKLKEACVKIMRLDTLVVNYYSVKKKDGYTFCLFCNNFTYKFIKHLIKVHADKDIISRYIANNSNLKTCAISFIRNQGLAHFKILTKIEIPAVKVRVDATQEVLKIQCDNCFSMFSSDTMWHHRRFCLQFTVSKMLKKL